MPFPTDEVVMETARGLVAQLQTIFGKHPGMRPAHAKGVILTGSFTPSAKAKEFSTAPHFNSPSTPIWVRFSNSTGLPNIPDSDPNADPRGIGIRFNLGPHKHTDIVSHSTPFFPTRTGAGFLEMLQAIAASPPDAAHPTPLEEFLGRTPSALAFVQAPKPAPVSYATDQYYSVSAFKLISASGIERFIRYTIVPLAGVQALEASDLTTKGPEYLKAELETWLATGPVAFRIMAQVAGKGDVTDDATVHWPESREVVELGRFELDAFLEDYEREAKRMILDPIPRVQGVEAPGDPLLEMRAAVYLLSGKERRAA